MTKVELRLPADARPTCTGTTKAGRRCRKLALAGSDRCATHRHREELLVDELAAIAVIAGSDDWRAHAWLLERRFPDRWARRPQRADVDERPVELEPAVADGLDELAGKRQARREVGFR